MFARRLDRVEPSATLKLADAAKELRRQGKDVVSLSVGEPDFPTPGFVMEAAEEALEDNRTGYTDTGGVPELREAVAEKLQSDNSIEASPDEVLVTPGAKFGIFLAFQSLVDPGDPVVLIDPSWVSFEAVADFSEAEVRRCPVDGDLLPKEEKFKELIEGASLAVINSPCNPTGAVYPESSVRAMVEAAEDGGATILSDEIYEKIVYGGEHFSPSSEYDNVVTINGFSKAYSMTGWRLGYVHGSEEVVSGMKRLQSHSATCANSFAQWGGFAALDQRERAAASVNRMVRDFERRREFLVDALNGIDGVECVEPSGAFYAFPSFDLDMDSFKVSDELLKSGVAVTPGAAFGPGGEGHLRLSYAVSEDQLNTAVERIEETFEELS